MTRSKIKDESASGLAPLSLEQLTREAVELHELLTELESAESSEPALYRTPNGDAVTASVNIAAIEATRGLLKQYMTGLARKVDGVASYLRFCKSQYERAKAEEERVYQWKKRWESRYDSLREYVTRVIVDMNLNPPKLESATNRLRIQTNSQSSVVFDQSFDIAKLDSAYLDVTVKMPADLWLSCIDLLKSMGINDGYTQLGQAEVSLSRLSADLAQGIEVPGASLQVGRHLRLE